MIIVEGPDGAGKSTLVEELSHEFDLEVGERATSDRNKLYTVTRQDTYTALSHSVLGHGKPQIWDRLFFSEMVYAPVIGRDCEFTHEEKVFVNRVLRATGCPVILCMPPWAVVQANVKGTFQMEGVHQNLEAIYAAYRTVCGDLPSLSWFDYTGEQSDAGYVSRERISGICDHYLDKRKVRSW